MILDKLQKHYIQKSRLFLYPTLGIKRGFSITPVETYMSWENNYNITDNVLVCLYDAVHFKNTEDRLSISNHSKILNAPIIVDDKMVCIFNLSEFIEDYAKIIKGEYSKLSEPYKNKILEFFKEAPRHTTYMKSYLYPTEYNSSYKQLYNLDDNTMKYVIEWCSPPDLKKECLIT